MPETDILRLPRHSKKPRSNGITEIMDVGTPTSVLKGYLEDHHEFIDYIKFGIGSAYITPNIKEKIKLIKSHDIGVWFGGTLFEKFYSQNKFNEYIDFLHEYEIDCIEVSAGTIELDLDSRLKCVEQANADFKVIAEVGSKDADKIVPPSEWIRETKALLSAGCDYVILEGRDSGTAGLYRQSGELREGLLADIISEIDGTKLIFEAPIPKAQIYFIKLLGPDVNLGNVKFQDILILESQRQGLRSDTFFLDDPRRTLTTFCDRRHA